MLIMLSASALIGCIAAVFLNGMWGTIVALTVFFAWFRFNLYQATTGLFKANLNSYFQFRRSGSTVDEALVSMVSSRYGSGNEQSLRIIKRIFDNVGTAEMRHNASSQKGVSEELTVVTAVGLLFQDENGFHWDNYNDKMYEKHRNQIRSLYPKIRNDVGLTTSPYSIPRYAGFWTRYLALCIDGSLLGVPTVITTYLIGIFFDLIIVPGTAKFLGFAALVFPTWVIIWVIYFSFMESSLLQASLGKLIMGIIVTDLEGKRISLGRAAKRAVCKLVSALPFYIGFIMAAFTQKKQALHDIMSNTLVIEI